MLIPVENTPGPNCKFAQGRVILGEMHLQHLSAPSRVVTKVWKMIFVFQGFNLPVSTCCLLFDLFDQYK